MQHRRNDADIDALELTIRSNNALRAAGVMTVEQLVSLEWKDLVAIPNLGAKSLSEIAWQAVQVLNGRVASQIAECNKRMAEYRAKDDARVLARVKKKLDEALRMIET